MEFGGRRSFFRYLLILFRSRRFFGVSGWFLLGYFLLIVFSGFCVGWMCCVVFFVSVVVIFFVFVINLFGSDRDICDNEFLSLNIDL